MKEKSAEASVEEILIRDILNGRYQPFSWLKPERELAVEFGYSRPVIHKAIIRLELKGLVTIVPRQGVKVNDYRETGKFSLLESIYDLYHEGISRSLNQSMLNFIQNNLEAMIFLIISGSPASRKECFEKQKQLKIQEGYDIFLWLKNFAFYSGNSIYPMLINEFKTGILNVASSVLVNGDRTELKKRLSDVIAILGKDCKKNRDEVNETVQQMFSFIEENWLKEGENYGIQFKEK